MKARPCGEGKNRGRGRSAQRQRESLSGKTAGAIQTAAAAVYGSFIGGLVRGVRGVATAHPRTSVACQPRVSGHTPTLPVEARSHVETLVSCNTCALPSRQQSLISFMTASLASSIVRMAVLPLHSPFRKFCAVLAL